MVTSTVSDTGFWLLTTIVGISFLPYNSSNGGLSCHTFYINYIEVLPVKCLDSSGSTINSYIWFKSDKT